MVRFLLPLFLLLSLFQLSAQSVNDYRTNGLDGNWTNVAIWEVFNGTTWVPATNYPGQVAGTNDISIIGNSEVTINSTIPNSFNSLSIGPGTMFVDADSSLDTPLITLNTGGIAEWTSNNTDLALPANASIVINGGNLVEDSPCNATKTITIGTSVFASCNGGGGGVDYDFGDINNNGGTLNVSPTSNGPLCVGQTLNLFANPGGAGSSGATFSWSGTGPGGYSFSSTLQDPTESSITAIGTYTYTVTITDSFSNSISESIDVVVNGAPNPPVSGGNQTVCFGISGTLTATVGAGETVDWYNAATGGTLLLAGNTSYSTSVAGSYYAETRNTTSGCVSTSRVGVILSNKSCTVITNRRITYRVNPGVTGPTGTPTTDMVINFFDDGQNGSGNPFQLQVRNATSVGFNYQIWLQNVPYASIPGLTLGDHTVNTINNGNGTFSYLFTSTSPISAFASRAITGSGGAPSPLGIGAACGCVSFFKL
ncbi:immunoglobulin domain-containing protein [Aquimarina sp. 433]